MIIEKSRLPVIKILTIGLLPSPVKILYYRLRGAKIGKGVSLGMGSVIVTRGPIEIGDHTSIGMFSIIECSMLKIGKRTNIRSFVMIETEDVVIGNDVTISETALIRALVPSRKSRIVICNRAHIFPFTMIDPSREIVIGEESSVGYATYIFTHGAYKSKIDGYPVEFGEVHIGKRVWLPCKVFIMPSVNIGDDAVIGTGALVSRDIPAGVLAVGAPAKAIKSREQYIVAYSEEEKVQILIDILNEFCQYLQDYGELIWRLAYEDKRPVWYIESAKGRNFLPIELALSPFDTAPKYLSVILQDVPEEIQKSYENTGKMWFSLGSRQCSARLDDLGEELREFFKRYGMYFARP